MIPAAFITEWQAQVAWPERYQAEQDLILSRLMVEIASEALLAADIIMERLGALLRNAPSRQQIADGDWRSRH